MNKRALLAIVVVVAMAAPLSALADGSDADGGLSTYYSQLTDGQKAIYEAMVGIDAGSATEASYPDGTKAYYYSVAVESTYVVAATSGDAAAEPLRDAIADDAIAAYQATGLDDPMAFWTWSNVLPTVSLSEGVEEVSAGEVYRVTSFTLILGLTEDYYSGDGMNMTEKVSATEEALAAIQIDAESAVDAAKGINALLCGSGYEYDPAVSSGSGEKCAYNHSLYGALVHEEDGKHVIVCDGYSALFKALCDREGVPCVTVIGWSVSSTASRYHAWSAVELEGKIYAVDSTWNATGSDDEAYLAVGSNTSVNGATFAQTHQAFLVVDEESQGVQYHFAAPVLSEDGYEWPESESILANISAYAPWIVITLICVLLAYVLFTMGRKGE